MRALLFAAIAATACLQAELLPIRTYTTSDGLASDHVDCIVPDSRGFIWFCTPEGLSRFDGYRMVAFTAGDGLPDRYVNALLETRSGVYFAATDRGLAQFHTTSGAPGFAPYRQPGDGFDKPVESVWESPSGKIWCGTRGGLFEVLRGARFRRQPLPGLDRTNVTAIREDPRGRLWVATTDGIVVFDQGGAAQHIGLADGLPNNWVNTLLLDQAGRLWAGTRDGLVLMRDVRAPGPAAIEQVFNAKVGLLADNVIALTEGPDGSIWMGTPTGISRLLPGNRDPKIQNYGRAQGLSDRQIISLSADKAGNIWAGTEAAGVVRIASTGFVTFREADGLATDRVFAILAGRSGTLLAVTQSEVRRKRSVSVFDGVKFRAIIPPVFGDKPSWGQGQILLQSRQGEWWAATKVGLCRFAAAEGIAWAGKQPSRCYEPDVDIFRVFEDSNGGIWASGHSGAHDRLFRFDPVTNTMAFFDQHAAGLVSAFAEDRAGNIWMGFWGGGLLRYNGHDFVRLAARDNVPAGAILALLIDSAGRLWAGSGAGGLGLLANPAKLSSLRIYDTSNGLASNTVLCLVEDNKARIYAGTGKGIDRLDPLTGRTKHYSSADGLPHGSFRSALRDGSGNLWFATTQGLARFTPSTDRSPGIPSVWITGLEAGARPYAVSQVGTDHVRLPELDPSRNQIQVTFVGFNGEPEENLRYRYKLDGAGGRWLDTREHTVNYAALEPGAYRFLVKAVNSEDQSSAAPAEIDFVVLPPFWRRWWFEALFLSACASLVVAAHRFRLAQAIRLERVRTAIATDLHDDIGASLSQIAVLSEVARVHGDAGSQANEKLDRVATLARELSDSMSDVVWSIRQAPDGLDSLVRRMREFGSELLEPQAIGFELRAPAIYPHLNLSMQSRRQILLIFKECVHNAARHSRSTMVSADFQVSDREIILRVSDNGCGLAYRGANAARGAGNGIPSMKRRASGMGGRIQWTAGPDGGCTVELRLPVRHTAFGKLGL